MAILKKTRPQATREITLASTSDIAFLLLIFFIVSTIFAAEQGLTLVLPGKEKDSTTIRVKQSNVATLKVHASNLVTLDGDPIEVNHILRTVQDRLVANPKLVIVLEIHPDADYGMMVACLDELRLANATRVSLKTSDR
jgi:biopolymer transport protein ExbD